MVIFPNYVSLPEGTYRSKSPLNSTCFQSALSLEGRLGRRPGRRAPLAAGGVLQGPGEMCVVIMGQP